MTTPDAIAEIIVADLLGTISNRSDDETVAFIASAISSKFPEAGKDPATVKSVIRVVNELIREHKLAAGIDPGTGLRPVKPISTTSLDISLPENVMPVFEIVDPATLWIDDAYQRSLSPRSLKKIAQMTESWDWNAYQPLTCVKVEIDGKSILKIVDGQHRGIAACSHPGIRELPIMIHSTETLAGEAQSFVSLNTTSLAIHPLQLHRARMVASDPDAQTLQNVCDKAGVKICKYPGDPKEVGETTAVNCIAAVIDRRGARLTGEMLELLVRAEFGPVGANDVRAAEYLMTAEELRGKFKMPDLIEAIRGRKTELEREARQNMVALGGAVFKNIARAWVAASRKRRPAAGKVAA
ncbi:MAG: hypothetical protein KL863_07505 [Rhizobium sp.]|nr:hypothetical protein [Rhizobium sp.]